MSRLYTIFLTLFFSFLLYAQDPVRTLIVKIDRPTSNDPSYLLYAQNGSVYEVSADRTDLVEEALKALENSSSVELQFHTQNKSAKEKDQMLKVREIRLLESGGVQGEQERTDTYFPYEDTDIFEFIDPMSNFSLTRLNDGQVSRLFLSMRKDLRTASECYNRAHVWSWEIYQRQRYNTGKMFLFFTSRYIREYRYKWWFHVAPFIGVNDTRSELVLDRQFMGTPRTIRHWTNAFMKNDAPCPRVSRYSDYSQNQQAQYCYVIPASMYYWQPYNLDNLERRGLQKRAFIKREVDHSYRDATGSWPW